VLDHAEDQDRDDVPAAAGRDYRPGRDDVPESVRALGLGLMVDTARPFPDVVDQIRRMEAGGLASALSPQLWSSYDALTTLALAGREAPGIELITGVLPIRQRHPIAMANQALTVQAATGGRLVLGIGLSHQFVVEGVHGYSYDRHALRMREYLEVLWPLLHDQPADFHGETLSANTLRPFDFTAPPPQVLLAALGSRMLELAGRRADGTITFMAGPVTLATHIVPLVRAAADQAGRPAPRIQAILPVCVTDDVDAAREEASAVFGIYDNFPSYRTMVDREGMASAADVALVGDRAAVIDALAGMAEAGATDVTAVPFGPPGDRERTFSLLAELSQEEPTDVRH
jgi:F420-dependent oxidoreductase-like protein